MLPQTRHIFKNLIFSNYTTTEGILILITSHPGTYYIDQVQFMAETRVPKSGSVVLIRISLQVSAIQISLGRECRDSEKYCHDIILS